MTLAGLILSAMLLGCIWQQSDALAVMSIDFGNEFMKIAIVKPGVPMEIALNEESQRKTNTLVSFRNGERTFSAAALNTQVKYPKVAYWYLRDLLAKSMDSYQVELYRQKFPYYNLQVDPDSNQLVFNDPSGEKYSPEELIGMIIEKAQHTAAKFAEQPITEAVVTVPPFFTQAERRALTRAVEMSGLKVLQLMNDNTAVALNYGVFRRKEFNTTAVHYMFFDMGATKTTATVVAYQLVKGKNPATGVTETNPQLTIKGVGYDRNLGGLDFQLRLRDHLARAFNQQKKTSQDVFQDQRALAKLLKEAERVKKVLSSNKDHHAQVESLLDDQDFKVKVTREELEAMCKDLFARVAKPVEDAIKASEVTWDEVSEVILMGGGTRMPLIQDILLTATDRKELGKSINTDESAALGAVYQAAHLSKGFKVKNFLIKDMTLFPIQVEFERVRTGEASADSSQTVKRTLFAFRNPFPQKKVITFNKHSADFSINVTYGELGHLSPVQKKEFTSSNIQEVTIEGVAGAFSKNKEGESKGVKAHFKMDDSGILTMDKAEVVFEKAPVDDGKDEESTLSKLGSYFFGKSEDKEGTVETNQEERSDNEQKPEQPEQKAEKDPKEEVKENEDKKSKEEVKESEEKKSKEEETKESVKEEEKDSEDKQEDENEEPSKDEEGKDEAGKDEASKDEQGKAEEKKTEEEKSDDKKDEEKKEEGTDEKKEDAEKKKAKTVVKENLQAVVKAVDVQEPSAATIKAAKKRIEELTRKDKEKRALAKARNDLETFIVDMQDKLYHDIYERSSTEGERQDIRDQLSAATDWLYDQDDQADKSLYKDKLKELESLTKDLRDRVREHEERPRALEALNSMVNYSEHFLNGMRNFTGDNQPFTQVEIATLEKLTTEIKEWNATMTGEQLGQPLTERPKLLLEDIGRKMAELDREVKYLINKAKSFRPKPPKSDKNKTDEAKSKANQTNETTDNTKSEDKTDEKTNKEQKPKKRPKQKRKEQENGETEPLQLDEDASPDGGSDSFNIDNSEDIEKDETSSHKNGHDPDDEL